MVLYRDVVMNVLWELDPENVEGHRKRKLKCCVYHCKVNFSFMIFFYPARQAAKLPAGRVLRLFWITCVFYIYLYSVTHLIRILLIRI